MLVPALIVASYLVRSRGRLAFAIDLIVSMPLALPPVAVGFVLLWFFGATGPLGSVTDGLAFSWVAMSIASSVVAFPLVVRAFIAGLAEVDPRLVFAARNLGASRFRAVWDVTLPLAPARHRRRTVARLRTVVRRIWRHYRIRRQHSRGYTGVAECDILTHLRRRLLWRMGVSSGLSHDRRHRPRDPQSIGV